MVFLCLALAVSPCSQRRLIETKNPMAKLWLSGSDVNRNRQTHMNVQSAQWREARNALSRCSKQQRISGKTKRRFRLIWLYAGCARERLDLQDGAEYTVEYTVET